MGVLIYNVSSMGLIFRSWTCIPLVALKITGYRGKKKISPLSLIRKVLPSATWSLAYPAAFPENSRQAWLVAKPWQSQLGFMDCHRCSRVETGVFCHTWLGVTRSKSKKYFSPLYLVMTGHSLGILAMRHAEREASLRTPMCYQMISKIGSEREKDLMVCYGDKVPTSFSDVVTHPLY